MHPRIKIIKEWMKQNRTEKETKQKCNFRSSEVHSFSLILKRNPKFKLCLKSLPWLKGGKLRGFFFCFIFVFCFFFFNSYLD